LRCVIGRTAMRRRNIDRSGTALRRTLPACGRPQ
jgi:hypothetical protein